MKIHDVREAYYDFSRRLSALIIKLNLSGIGVIWVLKIGSSNGSIDYGKPLLWALGIFVGSMSAALLQYIYATIAWGIYGRYREKIHTREDESFEPHCLINWPTNIFMWAKVVFTIAGYVVLVWHIGKQLL